MPDPTVTSRPALDVRPRRPGPGVALLLAVLAIPGTTLAWDLPHGGLWIGLPLAAAAVWLGARALRSESGGRRWMAIAAIVVAGLCLAQMLVYTLAVSL